MKHVSMKCRHCGKIQSHKCPAVMSFKERAKRAALAKHAKRKDTSIATNDDPADTP